MPYRFHWPAISSVINVYGAMTVRFFGRIARLPYSAGNSGVIIKLTFNLKTAVGRGEVYGFLGAWQGTATRNGYSISRICNAAMRTKNRDIHLVADSP